jgi:fumarate reductase subunit D
MDDITLAEVLDTSDARQVRPHRPRARPRGGGPRPSRIEPVFWLLFSGGGMVIALLFPVHIAILGIAYAAGWLPEDALSYDRIVGLARHPWTKLYLLGLVALPLFHWAHRFRFTVHHQFGVHRWKRLVAVACYGTAVVGTGLTVWVLLRI